MVTSPSRRAAFHFLDPSDGMTHAERTFNALLTALILLTIGTTMLSTVPSVTRSYGTALRAFDIVAAVFFAVEYAARLWVVPERRSVRHRKATLRDYVNYALSPLALVDLLVLVALLSPASLPLGALRGLRLLKLLGVLKLGRYSDALRLVGRVLARRSGELLTFGLIVVVLILIASALLYQVESRIGTKGFESIPHTLWWAVVTLTTTGYGDVYPVSPLGRFFAGILMLFGIGMVALPAGLIASGFSEALAEQDQQHAAQHSGWRVRHRFGPETIDVPVADQPAALQLVHAWEDAQVTPSAPGRLHREGSSSVNLNAAFQVAVIAPGEQHPS